MVHVSRDPPEEQEDLKGGVEVELFQDSHSPAETSDGSQQTPPEGPDPHPEPPERVDEEQEQETPPVLAEAEGGAEDGGSSQKKTRTFPCKYCPFSTPSLGQFTQHVDSSHPNVILNPRYLCTACSFSTNRFESLTEHNQNQHPGETRFRFKRLQREQQTVLEQTLQAQEDPSTEDPGPLVSTTVKTSERLQTLPNLREVSQQDQPVQDPPVQDQITAVSINGTVLIPEAVLQGPSHVSPLLQRPPNFQSVPKVAVPLNTSRYDPSLDRSPTLMASFHRFPYPTHAELSWLTAASRHPEEQIRVWFTTQRLKQGITWSPEEVEEARKKMFNGSAPPVHHTGPSSQQPPVYATVRQSAHARAAADGLAAPGSGGPAHKRVHLTTIFGPEPKRPVLAVAPHSGGDKMLMAPPPPPPLPQKDRVPMAPPPVAMEMKRAVAVAVGSAEVKRPPAATPLLPSAPPSSKGKVPPMSGSARTKPVASLPPIVFPESLTTPMIAPPPFAAPPFKNSLLVPLSSAMASKDLNPAEAQLPTPPPLIAPPMRRPPIIQSIRAPPKAPAQGPAFPPDSKLPEPGGPGYPRREALVPEANGASERRWPQDPSPAPNPLLERGVPPPAEPQKASVPTQFPLLERMKGKSGEQLQVLEEFFLRTSFPAQSDLDRLAGATQLSPQEVSSWLAERRALRDSLEQALLSSMGTKRAVGAPGATNHKMSQQLNGIHKAGSAPKAPPPHAPPPGAPGPPCSVPADSRALTLLKDTVAQQPWPSPEDCRTGPAHSDLTCWFSDGGVDVAERFHKNGVNGGQGPPPCSSDRAGPALVRRCQQGGVANSSRKALEAEFGRLMEQRANSFSSQLDDR